MDNLLTNYLPIMLFFGVAAGLSLVILVIPFFLAKRLPDAEKNSPYECGFEGIGKVRYSEFSGWGANLFHAQGGLHMSRTGL